MTTQYFYSPTTSGFYINNLHREMPSDVIEVTLEEYRYLIEGQSLGKVITYKSRKLQLVEYVPVALTWDTIRARRDVYLSKSDWTQIPDNQMDAELVEAWRVYRQALRDVTETFAHPDEVVWPVSPGNEDPTPTKE